MPPITSPSRTQTSSKNQKSTPYTMESDLLSNDDILNRIMAMLGPRHVCIGIGATCHRLRNAAKLDTVCLEFFIMLINGKTDSPVSRFFRILIPVIIFNSNSVVERILANPMHNG